MYSSNEEAIQKLQAAGGTSGFDMVVPTGAYIPQMVADGLLQTLDKDRLPNFATSIRSTGSGLGSGQQVHGAKDWGSTGWIYDNTVLTTPIRDLAGLHRRGDGPGERQHVACSTRPPT